MASKPIMLPTAAPARTHMRAKGRPFWETLRHVILFAGAIDVALFVLFLALGSTILAWINVLSVSMYGAAWVCVLRRKNNAALFLIWSEVLGHATVATILLGWDSAFHYYLLMFIPAIFIHTTTARACCAVLVLWCFYVALSVATSFAAPLEPLSAPAMLLIRYFNISAVFAMFAYLSAYYCRNITAAHKRLGRLASTDPLTGLYNRRHIMDVAHFEAGRPGSLSFIIADIDLFKAVNDSHGHDTGDSVLVAVSQAISATIREQDSASRWGGEEFLIVLQASNITEALEIAQRIRTAVAALAVRARQQTVAVSITLGVSSYRAGENISDTIRRADDALFRGKQAGRDRVEASA